MYNRILKRPMFRRGGPSYQSQGTGITSPFDIPRGGYYGGGTIGGGMIHGNPMGYRTGFDDPKPDTFEQIDIETKALEAPKKGEWLSDVIGSFGAYGNPYKESGEAKTIGEMGYEQAEGIKAIRDEREARRKLAALEGLGTRKDKLIRTEDQESKLAVLKQQHAYDKIIEGMRGENLEFKQQIKNERNRADQKIAALDKTDPKYNEQVAAIEAEFNNVSRQIVRGTPGMTELIQNAKDRLYKIHEASTKIGMPSYLQVMVEQWNAKNPDKPKTIVDIIQEQAVADVAGTTAAASILIQQKAKGGRVGYQFGTPNTGAMPDQGSPNIMAQATTDAEVEDAYGVSVDQGIEGQQASVQMPYQEFRASIPAEVSDEIVQLIYYNQDAFADFAQISTQADVYAFNNKYGVSLVLPMDTETT
jgi:hypothetical protein